MQTHLAEENKGQLLAHGGNGGKQRRHRRRLLCYTSSLFKKRAKHEKDCREMIYNVDGTVTKSNLTTTAMGECGHHRENAKRKRTSLMKIIRNASRTKKGAKEDYGVTTQTKLETPSGTCPRDNTMNGKLAIGKREYLTPVDTSKDSTRQSDAGLESLSIVTWNSCESFEEDDTWTSRHNASLRRSRASLVFPTSELNPRGRPINVTHGNDDFPTSFNQNVRSSNGAPAMLRYNSVNVLEHVKCSVNRSPIIPFSKFASSHELQCNEKESCETGNDLQSCYSSDRVYHDNTPYRNPLPCDERIPANESTSRYKSMPDVDGCITEESVGQRNRVDKWSYARPVHLPLIVTSEDNCCVDEDQSIAQLQANKHGNSLEECGESPLLSMQDLLFVHEDAAREMRGTSNGSAFSSSPNSPTYGSDICFPYQSTTNSFVAKKTKTVVPRKSNSFQETSSTQIRVRKRYAQLFRHQSEDTELENVFAHAYRDFPLVSTDFTASSYFDDIDSEVFNRSGTPSIVNTSRHQSSSIASFDTKDKPSLYTQSKVHSTPKTFELRRSKSYSQMVKKHSLTVDRNLVQIQRRGQTNSANRKNSNLSKIMFRSSSESDLKQKRAREQLKRSMLVVRNNSLRSLLDDRMSLLSVDSQRSRPDRPRSSSTASSLTTDDELPLAFAEAVWDYASLNPAELSFQCGDVITIYCMDEATLWWGRNKGDEGWFSPTFVRVRVSQVIEEDEIDNIASNRTSDGPLSSGNVSVLGRHNLAVRQTSDIRSKCIRELLTSEREYVKTLNDVIEGYFYQMKNRDDIFPAQTVKTIFSNILEIYRFHTRFLDELQSAVNQPNSNNNNNNNDISGISISIGGLFEKNRRCFEMYSDYCNNHPYACMRLMELQKDIRHQKFFEACRLKQNMINISLDGFLLTPVQKICKYPLQLKELLKHTAVSHDDYEPVRRAWQTMKDVASLINERKRGVETISQLAHWQLTVYNWKGRDLTEVSSELIYKGKASLTCGERSAPVQLFLFDHQLIICTADSLKKNGLAYFDRIDLDQAQHSDDLSGQDGGRYLTSPSCSWKMHVPSTGAWYLFSVETNERRSQWSRAFSRERSHVADQNRNGGIFVPMDVRRTAIELARNQKDCGDQKKRPQRKSMVLLPMMADSPKTQKKLSRKLSFDYGMFIRKNRRQSRKESTNCSSKDSKR